MKKLRVLSLLFVVMAIFMSGCADAAAEEGGDASGTALAVVIGNHSNAYAVPLNTETIVETLSDVCSTYGVVSFIRCDGEPIMFYKTTVNALESGYSDARNQIEINKKLSSLCSVIQSDASRAVVPEVDTLKAIEEAAEFLKGADDTLDKRMLVLDTGLGTAGYLDFTTLSLYASPEDVVLELKEKQAIPDVEGVDITWMFFGDVAGEQSPLTNVEKNNAQEIVRSVLLEGGARSVVFTTDAASNIIYEGLPEVTPVPVGDRTIDVEVMETITLDASRVAFVGDQATFVNPDEAKEELQTVAELLLAYPENKVYIVGTTATGSTKEFCVTLSWERANAVQEVLIQLGVRESQLETLGLGYEGPWHLEDLGEDGLQIESIAYQNRQVKIIDKQNAKELEGYI